MSFTLVSGWPSGVSLDDAKEECLSLLLALDGVEQDPTHHPEGDALYHSLQVWQVARQYTPDPALLAAALFHDIGKAVSCQDHAAIGAEDVTGLLPERSIWLIRHHMDLLYKPKATRRRWWGSTQLYDLEQLRRWDLAGRDPRAIVCSPEEAIEALFQAHHSSR